MCDVLTAVRNTAAMPFCSCKVPGLRVNLSSLYGQMAKLKATNRCPLLQWPCFVVLVAKGDKLPTLTCGQGEQCRCAAAVVETRWVFLTPPETCSEQNTSSFQGHLQLVIPQAETETAWSVTVQLKWSVVCKTVMAKKKKKKMKALKPVEEVVATRMEGCRAGILSCPSSRKGKSVKDAFWT